MHIACIILSFYRAIQLICLLPLWIEYYIRRVRGKDIWVNGLPPWCSQYPTYDFVDMKDAPEYLDEIKNIELEPSSFLDEFLANSMMYFIYDVAWVIMAWNSASIGTPTEPMRRDVYLRNLIKFKMFVSNIYPFVLVALGVYYIYDMRKDNYGCGTAGEPLPPPDETPYYGLFCCLIVTYAVEVLFWPAVLANKIIKLLRMNRFFDRRRVEGRGGKAERFERKFGLILKMLSCITRGKAGGQDLKNKGELKEFASHVMCLLNNETKLDLVLSDIYCGMRMLSNVQAERKVEAIKKMARTNKALRKQARTNGNEHESWPPNNPSKNEQADTAAAPVRRRASMFVLQMQDKSTYDVCERDVLQESIDIDQTAISDGAHFVKYASYIYVALPTCVIDNFMDGEVCSSFKRGIDTLFSLDEFRLSNIGLEHAVLCYANFENGIVATPYSIIVDDEMEVIVIVVRGTRSLEDLVVDLQFVPESLEKVGRVCGFQGEGHYCHKGFLARCKWMYNDIKKSKVLKTLYSEQSPFKDYPLVLCGHSLGAGCASILALMLRASFPSLRCFAYEPPGCIFDDDLSEYCAEFITSFVRHDDLVPRLSYHNFETLRDEFLNVLARIKVPKIQLFWHLRETPYSERFVSVNNAKVLRPLENIPSNTSFSEQVERLRAERAKKNMSGINRVQLFIPGKIVHLVDTSGNGNYIPYWAPKEEFNQLEISKRMYADHDIHSLVDIIRNTQLGGANTVSLAFNDAPQIDSVDDGEPVADIRLFTSCCSNPYGKLPMLLWFLGLVATSISTEAATGCDFALATYSDSNATIIAGLGISTYHIRNCTTQAGQCDGLMHYLNKNDECRPYLPKQEEKGHGARASVGTIFLAISVGLGWLSVFMLMLSMCYIYRQRTWWILTVLLLATCLCHGLSLLVMGEITTFCAEPNMHCSMGSSGIKLITANCIWFIMAIGSGYLAKVGKKSEGRSEIVEDSNDPPKALQQMEQEN